MTFAQRFAGRRALVTGGGDGIGRALAMQMAQAGLTVCALDIRREAAEATVAAMGGGLAVEADVSDRDSLERAAAQVRDRLDGLEVLWINAGVGTGAAVSTASPRTLEWVLGVNVFGVAWTAQAFLPLLRAGVGDRAIGVTASLAAISSPEPGANALYPASKFGTLGMAEALRAELAPEGVGVTLFCPGLLSTDIWDAARARPERLGGVRRMDPAIAGRWTSAESPDRAVGLALATMAEGGGWCVVPSSGLGHDRVTAHLDAIGAGVRPQG